MTEKELIDGIIQHDRIAINRLVGKYQTIVIKTAYHFLGNMEDAEDTAQEVFLEIIRSIGKFRGASSLSTWIYRITINRSLNALKKNRRSHLFKRLAGLKGENGSGPAEVIEEPSILGEYRTDDIMRWLKTAMDTLPGNQRTAFILNQYEELSYQEIAIIMNTSVSAVESLLHRAKRNLQHRLSPHFNGIKI